MLSTKLTAWACYFPVSDQGKHRRPRSRRALPVSLMLHINVKAVHEITSEVPYLYVNMHDTNVHIHANEQHVWCAFMRTCKMQTFILSMLTSAHGLGLPFSLCMGRERPFLPLPTQILMITQRSQGMRLIRSMSYTSADASLPVLCLSPVW